MPCDISEDHDTGYGLHEIGGKSGADAVPRSYEATYCPWGSANTLGSIAVAKVPPRGEEVRQMGRLEVWHTEALADPESDVWNILHAFLTLMATFDAETMPQEATPQSSSSLPKPLGLRIHVGSVWTIRETVGLNEAGELGTAFSMTMGQPLDFGRSGAGLILASHGAIPDSPAGQPAESLKMMSNLARVVSALALRQEIPEF